LERLKERGATPDEVISTVLDGERFEAKYNRTGCRRNFSFDGEWRGCQYTTKQIETFAVEEDGWLVITVIVKFF